MGVAFYDGAAIFGQSNKVRMIANPTASQLSAFFGVTGTFALFGGTRGRVFEVEGVLVGADLAAIADAEGTIESYRDGLARAFVDTLGSAWPSVLLVQYARTGGWHYGMGGVCQPFKAALAGML